MAYSDGEKLAIGGLAAGGVLAAVVLIVKGSGATPTGTKSPPPTGSPCSLRDGMYSNSDGGTLWVLLGGWRYGGVTQACGLSQAEIWRIEKSTMPGSIAIVSTAELYSCPYAGYISAADAPCG